MRTKRFGMFAIRVGILLFATFIALFAVGRVSFLTLTAMPELVSFAVILTGWVMIAIALFK